RAILPSNIPVIHFLPSVGSSITHRFLIFNRRRCHHLPGMCAKDLPSSRPTPWKQVLVVCRKCGKKLHGGFGAKGKDSLKSVLRQGLRDSGRRREVRVFETSCMGICPKGGVTALNASRPGTIHVIAAGTEAAAALDTLFGDDAVPDGRGVESA
ncbi:MAG TPA: hypothetical protein VHO91_00705, partial [Rhodopila sp.]|nr:hypothetical protein [Rhodopila sp.]